MKKLCALSIAALLATAGASLAVESAAAANAKLSKAECSSLWGRADSAGTGLLSSTQASSYVSDFSKVDANADGKLTSSEFLAGCKKGLIHDSASSGASEGASGSSSGGADVPPKSGTPAQ